MSAENFTQVSQVESNILSELRRLNDKMDGVNGRIDTVNSSVISMGAQVTAMKEDIDGAKSHGDRLTKLETRVDDADAARRSINENIRWLIGLIIVALIGVAGLFFKK